LVAVRGDERDVGIYLGQIGGAVANEVDQHGVMRHVVQFRKPKGR
jgi:hypothetical protein